MPDDLDPRRWQALAVCVSALFLTLLDLSVVNLALPSIARGTGAAPSELQWVVSGYALAFGMVPIIAGRLGDDRGRKRMLLVGVAAFMATSALVGLAPTPGVLIAGRVLQGLSGGLINPQVSGLVQQLFPPGPERSRAFGVLGTTVGVSMAAGPVLGGAILAVGGADYGWRITFLLNVPVGLVSFLLIRAWVPDTARRATTRPSDLTGALLLAAGIFGLLFPAVEFDASHDARLVLLVIPALALLGAFVLWERGPARRRGYPLIDLGLFRIRSFSDGIGLAFLYFCAFAGMPLILALFLQDGLGFSPFASGLTASAYAVGTAISAPVAGRLVSRMGGWILVLALTVFVVGAALTALTAHLATSAAGAVAPVTVAMLLAGPLLLAGLGGGGVITPNQSLALAEVDVTGGSTAGGVLQTAQRFGSSLGAAVISAVYYATAAGATDAVGYGRAYSTALLVTIGFALAALALAVRDVRRR